MIQSKKLFYLYLLVAVLLVGCSGTVLAEDNGNSGAALAGGNQNSLTLGIKPFLTVEYERQLTGHLDIVANYSYFPNIFSSDDDDKFEMYSLGLSLYPFSDSMQGLYIGAEANRFRCTGDFLGIKFKDDAFEDGYAASLGYKRIFDSGFVFDIGVKGIFYDDDDDDDNSGAFPYVALGFGW